MDFSPPAISAEAAAGPSGGALPAGPAPRLLVLRGGALGDFLLTLPVLRALRARWPGASLELVAHRRPAELALIAGLATRVRSLDAAFLADWFTPRRIWPAGERADLAAYDWVLSYLNDPDGALRANLLGGGVRRLTAWPPKVAGGHAADHFLRPLLDLGLQPPPGPGLPWPAERRSAARRRLACLGLQNPVIALHPGSGSPRKNWPLDRFLDLADSLRRRRIGTPVFIPGEAESGARRVLESMSRPPALLADRPLPEIASILAACRCYVGNDSGITHLAAALACPTVAIFGPTDPAVWGPRGERVTIIRAHDEKPESLRDIDPETVAATVQGLVRKD